MNNQLRIVTATGWLAACGFAVAGCAAPASEKKEPVSAAQQTQCPKVDVARISEISDIDKENQEQLGKVSNLEKRLNALQERLAGAVAPTNAAAAAAASSSGEKGEKAPPKAPQVEVAAAGNRVRVRMSSELLFHPASARISGEGRKALDQVASVLKEGGSKRVEIAGHTDNLPMTIKKYGDNWDLSMARARRVGEYLIQQGVDPKKLVMAGYADRDPVDPGDSQEARAKNRRVEIFIEPTE